MLEEVEQVEEGTGAGGAGTHPLIRKRQQKKFGVPEGAEPSGGTSGPTTTTGTTGTTSKPTATPSTKPTPVSAWYQEAYVKAANADAHDYFGYSVSLSGDTLAVGAHGEDSATKTIINGTTASSNNLGLAPGAVYVYRRAGNVWSQEAYVKASNAGHFDSYGFSVSLSGDRLAVGATEEDSNQDTITNGTSSSVVDALSNSGAVYVYRREGAQWAQEAYIKAVNVGGDDEFGSSVSLSGDTLAVGARSEDSNQNTITNGSTASFNNSAENSGAVYIYRRSNGLWSQEAYVKAPNLDGHDRFGHSISLSGETLAIGAPFEDSSESVVTNGSSLSGNNASPDAGAAYVYRRTGVTWQHEAYIKASNTNSYDNFAKSLSISGDTLAVGAHAEDSNQIVITNGTNSSSNNSLSESGAVYVYRRNGLTWAQESYIKAANADSGDNFGHSLAVGGNTLIVGAPLEDSNQTTITNGSSASSEDILGDAGAVYVYRRSGNSWLQEAYVKAANAGGYLSPTILGDYFGFSVSISGDTLAVGAHQESSNQRTITNGQTASFDNSSTNAGAVYIYRNLGRMFDPDVRVTDVSSSSISFNWSNKLGAASQVKIAAAESGVNAPAENCDGGLVLDAGVETYTYSGLTPNSKYGFRLCAWDGVSASAGSLIWETTGQ